MRRRVWIAARLAVVIVGFASGALWPVAEHGGVGVTGSLDGLALWLLGPVVALLLVIGVQAGNPRSDAVWEPPAWDRNPFALGQPLQFFHLGAFYFLAAALGAVVARFFVGPEVMPWAWCFFLVGVGTWLGVRLCMIVYRKKMAAA